MLFHTLGRFGVYYHLVTEVIVHIVQYFNWNEEIPVPMDGHAIDVLGALLVAHKLHKTQRKNEPRSYNILSTVYEKTRCDKLCVNVCVMNNNVGFILS